LPHRLFAGAATLAVGQAARTHMQQQQQPASALRAIAATAPELERLLDGADGVRRMTGVGAAKLQSSAAKAEFEDAAHSLIHGHTAPGDFERFDVWVDGARTIAVVRLGEKLCGHRGIVHGGATAAICDELFGWTAHHCAPGTPTRIFTANLSVNYLVPLPANTTVVVTTRLARVEGRKLFLECVVESVDGATRYASGTSLFIVARPSERAEGTPAL
jgi:acyl-coenzyme A thioesterase PaaI-like protein